ncbi:MAG: COQ9 family protein [Sphingomonadaceae bacterium]
MDQSPADMTLDELRPVLARVLPSHAGFDGWGDKAVESAAAELGVAPAVARLAFGGDRMDMIDAWFQTIDSDMLAALPPERLTQMKIRERITALVEARLSLVLPHRESLRRAMAILAFPANAPRALKLGWRSADAMWRAAGDTATDYNHYTKRAILGSVYAATLAVFLNDETDDLSETRAFLGRRIDGVMRFEKAKAQITALRPPFSPARFIGRLRYSAR